jgi:hypothetical protein
MTLERGFRRVVKHGRHTLPALNGNDMDTHADDLVVLSARLELKEAVKVRHSTGGSVEKSCLQFPILRN